MADEKKAPAAASEGEKAEPTKPFWLVVVKDEDDDPPSCIQYENEQALAAGINEHVLGATTPLHAFAFEGARVAISAPRPVCSFKRGDKKVDVGRDGDEYNESGLIMPLSRAHGTE